MNAVPGRRTFTRGDRVRSPRDAFLLFGLSLSSLAHERVVVAYLGRDSTFLELSTVAEGAAAAAALPLSAILRGAVLRGARKLILAHNHPSGDATPSIADIRATRALAAGAMAVGLTLIDHIVFARDEACSFRLIGLM